MWTNEICVQQHLSMKQYKKKRTRLTSFSQLCLAKWQSRIESLLIRLRMPHHWGLHATFLHSHTCRLALATLSPRILVGFEIRIGLWAIRFKYYIRIDCFGWGVCRSIPFTWNRTNVRLVINNPFLYVNLNYPTVNVRAMRYTIWKRRRNRFNIIK